MGFIQGFKAGMDEAERKRKINALIKECTNGNPGAEEKLQEVYLQENYPDIEKKNHNIKVATSGLSVNHEVIDVVWASVSIIRFGYDTFTDVSGIAFNKCKGVLRELCALRGGDAVISTNFDAKVISDAGKVDSETIVINAFGTVVKLS